MKTIDHIIETIHTLRGKYDNDVNFLIGGDFNRLKITDILDSYGALKQVCSIPTRKSATLEILLTDLHTLYHPPTTLPPLQVDDGVAGSDSDHDIVVFAPLLNQKFEKKREKKTIKTRPLPLSGFGPFEKDLQNQDWAEVYNEKDANEKVKRFHTIIRAILEEHFPEKCVKISSLDKKWFNPELKQIHRKMQREFYKKRKSPKWKKLKKMFKKLKKKSVKSVYSKFVNELKSTDPGKWYQMAKRIGAVDTMHGGDIKVDILDGVDNKQGAELIAQHFASVANEYSPLNTSQLPAYLPAQRPPQVTEYSVYKRIDRLKNTRSTLSLDLPNKIRKAFSVELATPSAHIINACLEQQVFPDIWKEELVSPVPKILYPKTFKNLRKISSTSDFSKLYEGFLKDWIMSDISGNIDIGQYGGQRGVGTEHLVVALVDRILQLLDSNTERSAVIAACVDWQAAFDRQDPTLAINKFIALGVRPSLIPILVSYLTNRKMKVKYNGEISNQYNLNGGGPQGTLIGQIEYLVNSNDNADCVNPEDRYKYIDDLSVLELVMMTGILREYDFYQHVASDIGIDQVYLPPDSFRTQDTLDRISAWTAQNLMKLNEEKSNYMIFSRTKENFATRITLNNVKLERLNVSKILGIWISEDMSWTRNTREICLKAYARMSLITKLRYVGVQRNDLLEVYILFIRSLLEYCCVLYHSSLTQEDAQNLERVQKTALKVILGESYEDYSSALNLLGLQTLDSRRESRCLDFAIKCTKHPLNSRFFPLQQAPTNYLRQTEKFVVNFARTSTYRDSAIPYCQRLLNANFKK